MSTLLFHWSPDEYLQASYLLRYPYFQSRMMLNEAAVIVAKRLAAESLNTAAARVPSAVYTIF